jgi:hypothetical protein
MRRRRGEALERRRFTEAALAFLLAASSAIPSLAEDLGPIEQELSQAYDGKTVFLRGFYSGAHLA